jgi:hypothetical protein
MNYNRNYIIHNWEWRKWKLWRGAIVFSLELMTTSTRRWRNVEVAVLFNVRKLKFRGISVKPMATSTHWLRRAFHGHEFFDYCWCRKSLQRNTRTHHQQFVFSEIRLLDLGFRRLWWVTMDHNFDRMKCKILRRITESSTSLQHLTTLQQTGKLSVLCKCLRKDYDVCKENRVTWIWNWFDYWCNTERRRTHV